MLVQFLACQLRWKYFVDTRISCIIVVFKRADMVKRNKTLYTCYFCNSVFCKYIVKLAQPSKILETERKFIYFFFFVTECKFAARLIELPTLFWGLYKGV